MFTYKLKRYSLVSTEEELIAENDDQSILVTKANELSDKSDYWTYRIDTYDGDVCIGKFRWFNNGKEITDDLIWAVNGQ